MHAFHDGFVLIKLLAGQVHGATLRGQEVVVKVQRPGLKDLFDIDFKHHSSNTYEDMPFFSFNDYAHRRGTPMCHILSRSFITF